MPEAPRLRSDPPHARAAAQALLPRSWFVPCKRALDVLGAAVLLVLAAPLLLLLAALVKLTSRGPVVYAQERVGLGGKPFTLYKLRSMSHDCETATGPRWATADDPRVTPLGRFLRKTHLDELPQLWNVLRGDMSLIGPRPERPVFVDQLERLVPWYGGRLLVRPGITGLAQVLLPPDSDVTGVRRKIAYDLYYVRYLGPWIDLRILLGTIRYAARTYLAFVTDLLALPRGERVERAYAELVGPAPGVPAPHGAANGLGDTPLSQPVNGFANGHHPAPDAGPA